MNVRIAAVTASALLLATGMAILGVVSARALRERDRAVRDGVLLVIAQEIESDLRRTTPDAAGETLAAFVQRRAESLAGVELVGRTGVVARAGTVEGVPTESKAALGPAWRMFSGGGYGPGRSPFTLRLYPSAALGQHGSIATAVLVVSATAAAALFLLALMASRGLLERERRLAAESEHQRLRVAALAGAGLAHRIRTPLATIKGTAQLLEAHPGASERAGRIVEEAGRIDGMIRRLLDFARPPERHPESFDVARAARQIASRFQPVTVDGPESLSAYADPVHFETAFEELLANARAFDSGTLAVSLRREAHRVAVEVRDHGAGLAASAEEALEPYYTTRADGTGLGLSIASALIRSNDGELDLRNAEGGGCAAVIRLPEAR